MTKKQTDYLNDHIIDQLVPRKQGLKMIKDMGRINDEEYTKYLEKIIDEFDYKVREFRLMNKLVSVAFAVLFTGIQIFGGNNVLVRGRTGRSGRRNEYEFVLDKA